MLGKSGSARSIDLTTFSIYLGLVVIGWLMIYAVTVEETERLGFLASTAGKQAVWIAISLTLMAFIYLIDWKFWQTFAYLIYAFSLVLLVGVLFLGSKINGATSWFSFGGATLQPSEFAKFGACLAMASFLGTYNTNLRSFRTQLIAFSIFLMPAGLILLQPDAGSALVFFSFLLVLYREGLSPNYYIAGAYLALMSILGLVVDPKLLWLFLLFGGLAILANQYRPRSYWLSGVAVYAIGAFLLSRAGYGEETLLATALAFIGLGVAYWSRRGIRLAGLLTTALLVGGSLASVASYTFNNVLKPHHQERINVWLRPQICDPRGALYNVLQSKMAISSGGVEGKGFLEGTMTKLNYVPEQSTDFIFCTIGEEQGFIGSFAIILLFLLLLLRLTIIAERQRSNFSRVYAYSLAGILFIHFFINIGMTMGLVPVIGIPLPLISKGGSSLLGFTLMIGVLLKLDAHRYRI